MDHQADPVMSVRFLNLKKSFQLGIRALLTAFSKEEVNKAFPSLTDAQRESLYRMFIQAIKSLHANIEEEFESICHETQVSKILAMIEQLVEEQSLDMLSMDKENVADIKEKISKAKKDEAQYLTSMLEKAEEQNNALRARIETLKKQQNNGSASSDIVEKLRSWNSNYESFN
ncbi:Nuclear MIS12/MIND complex subunit PMF1/Nnf1 protein [Dioscorea alata]|uniref:Nuclear MIS12/MIND complex subunit PMF1/Nnf1 protein n=2 Tax=Dioscorea alata TaxID=55571 RepID=A0ACB7V5P3_DIOAL|nr:Nuclear MIS12/MIND complex subunit PMF1/Nnf1 protein [Dioscorea alata]KAH7668770.1 Nuclear MIS12/MIND complex subunit PMF1/Nnf1 protein [Dioscorea alata]